MEAETCMTVQGPLPPIPAKRRRRSLADRAGRGFLMLLLPVAVGLQRLAAAHPQDVENVYSRVFYPLLSEAQSHLSGALPLSLAELLIVALLLLAGLRVGFVWWSAWRRRMGRWRAVRTLAGDALALAGALYFSFLVLWGLNYQRLPFASSVGLPVEPTPASELELLCVELTEEANQLRVGLPEDPAGVMRFSDGLPGVLARAELGYAAAARRYPILEGRGERPKPAFASPLLSYLGVTGIYCPFTGEAYVNATVPPPEVPFCASHELAHQRGFAREDEANYLGYLACRFHPDADFRYSGTMVAASYALSALLGVDREPAVAVAERRSAAVRRDLAALQAWSLRYRTRVTEVSQQVNDTYLRTQGLEDGVASYGRMVDLLLAERRLRGRGVD